MKSKWITITDAGVSDTGKTRVWDIKNTRTGETIGQIRWYGGWRKYAFYPIPAEFEGQWVVFDAECMGQISEKLVEVNASRARQRKAHG